MQVSPYFNPIKTLQAQKTLTEIHSIARFVVNNWLNPTHSHKLHERLIVR